MTTREDAILIGGPRDGENFTSADAALVELDIDGMIHRYIRTTQTREDGGAARTVYTYDGMVSPTGGAPGSEDPQARLISPLAKTDGEDSRS